MSSTLLLDDSPPGFCFDNCRRNAFLNNQGYSIPKATKTGTTIAGVIFKDGVILGADTRATEDTIVSDKNCSKIHYLTQNIYCCGAGTAADTEMTTRTISSQLELMEMNMARKIPVAIAVTNIKRFLFKYQGHVGAHLVIGGVDNAGPHIYSIHSYGSADKIPYTTMGSGMLAAMSVFESRWRKDMSKEDAMVLVRDAIAAGIFNDLGSGSNIDLCIITADKVEYIRPHEIANKKGVRNAVYKYPKGSTAILTTKDVNVEVDDILVRNIDVQDYEFEDDSHRADDKV